MTASRVIQGKPQALAETVLGRPVSVESFLTRFVLLNQDYCERAPLHIAVHLIKGLEDAPPAYVDAHSHPACDEVGLVIGQPGALEYEMILDGKVHRIASPASIFIAAGTVHRARALRGNGAYVCILLDPEGPRPSSISKAAVSLAPTMDRVIALVRQAAELKPNECISADTGLVGSGLWLDSVAVLQLLLSLEKEFGIELDRSSLSHAGALSTVGSLTRLVDALLRGEQ